MTLMTESEEERKSLLMKMKEESEKVGGQALIKRLTGADKVADSTFKCLSGAPRTAE